VAFLRATSHYACAAVSWSKAHAYQFEYRVCTECHCGTRNRRISLSKYLQANQQRFGCNLCTSGSDVFFEQ
jgi:hypothetical protein